MTKKLSKEAQFIMDCRDPFFFIEKVWGLKPQPAYSHCEVHLKSTEPEQWKAEWFGEEMKDGKWKWDNFQFGKHITWQQSAILEGVKRAVFDYGNAPNKIAVKTGNGIGKSCLAGWLVPWFMFCFHKSIVPCTAPTSSQMHDVLWKEVASWINRMPDVYKSLYNVTAGYIRIAESPEDWYARARTSRKEAPEAFSGVHAPSVMAIADEASGVPDIIFDYGAGIKTAPFWLFLKFSNPTRLVGNFKRAFDETSDHRKFTFDSQQSPVVDWKFVKEKKDASGFDSDDFRVFVQGRFPKSDAMDDLGYVPLFSQAEIEQAQVRDGNMKYDSLGIDPSGEGHDKTAFVGRNNHIAKILAEEAISTSKSISARGNTFIAEYEIPPENVIVDNFGTGANVALEMSRAKNYVTPLNVGDKSEDTRYMNLRAELSWAAREWIKKGGQLVKDKRWNELLNIRYRYNESGKLQIMGKDKMRKEGIKSPNFYDAFMLTFSVSDFILPDTIEDEDPEDW